MAYVGFQAYKLFIAKLFWLEYQLTSPLRRDAAKWSSQPGVSKYLAGSVLSSELMADMANQSWHSFLLSPDLALGIITSAKSIIFDNSCLKDCVAKDCICNPSLGQLFCVTTVEDYWYETK